MSYTRALRRGVRWVLLALVVSTLFQLSIGTKEAEASSEWPRSLALESAEIPEEHGAEDKDPESNLPYLFAVFIITWAVFFAYVFIMSRRQRQMQREIDALAQALSEKPGETFESEGSPQG